jgi:hypothetical protein
VQKAEQGDVAAIKDVLDASTARPCRVPPTPMTVRPG